ERLQQVGGHLWEWMVLNYAATVLMGIRRLVDSQRGTVNLKQLMHAIIDRPDVITRGRRRAIHGPIGSVAIREHIDGLFTENWVRHPNADRREDDQVDPEIVRADLRSLESALEAVTEFANRTVAHKTRMAPGNVTYGELDAAFAAIEQTLTRYYA